MQLLRADRIALVEPTADVGPNGNIAYRTHDGSAFSETLVARAFEAKKAVAVLDTHAGPSDSVVLSGARSILCVPIFARERPGVCLYVTHSQVGLPFGELEERLAEFIATVAGAALESVQTFAQAKALSEERARLYLEAQSAILQREEFLSVASHELRTPLTPLTLQLQSMQRLLDPAENARLSDKVRVATRQTERLTKLIDNLLDVSRISAGRLVLDVELVNLADVARDVVERFSAEARAAGSAIAFAADEGVSARCDRSRIEQVIANLVSNAIKYGLGKPIDLRVAGEPDDVRIYVVDRGIGLSPDDDVNRLFQRFERSRGVQHYGGLGLGLYITKQIVDAHNGSIGVESVHKCGSTFTVRIPREWSDGASPLGVQPPSHATV